MFRLWRLSDAEELLTKSNILHILIIDIDKALSGKSIFLELAERNRHRL